MGLDPEQADNARVIITVGQRLGVPPRGWVIAIATALQESGLRNLPHLGADNDHNSLGLFQQRPSQGWGTPEQITDPVHASTVFYERLLQVDNWQQLPLTQAAQQVQSSAFPSSYARHEPRAAEIVAALSGVHCGHISAADWTLPVGAQIVSGFRTAARPTHYGIDFTDGRSTTIRAAAAGTVTHITCQATLNGAPYSCDIDGSPQVTGCGWYLDILHTGGALTRYCHLLTRPHVNIGDQVTAGQPIGQVGSSGNSSGPHLHFEIELHRPIAQHPSGVVTIERHQTDPVAFYATQGITITCATSSNHCQPVHSDREPDAHVLHHVAGASDLHVRKAGTICGSPIGRHRHQLRRGITVRRADHCPLRPVRARTCRFECARCRVIAKARWPLREPFADPACGAVCVPVPMQPLASSLDGHDTAQVLAKLADGSSRCGSSTQHAWGSTATPRREDNLGRRARPTSWLPPCAGRRRGLALRVMIDLVE
jgi:murein DD-endopeptidase MepM/ murein hydrolase activator NlpD